MGPVAKHVFLVTDPARLEATVRTAFEIARTGRPGPVVVDIPKDVQNWAGSFRGAGTLPIPGFRRRSAELAANAVSPETNAVIPMIIKTKCLFIFLSSRVLLVSSASWPFLPRPAGDRR